MTWCSPGWCLTRRLAPCFSSVRLIGSSLLKAYHVQSPHVTTWWLPGRCPTRRLAPCFRSVRFIGSPLSKHTTCQVPTWHRSRLFLYTLQRASFTALSMATRKRWRQIHILFKPNTEGDGNSGLSLGCFSCVCLRSWSDQALPSYGTFVFMAAGRLDWRHLPCNCASHYY